MSAWGRRKVLVGWSLARVTSLPLTMLLVWWLLARAASLLQLRMCLARWCRALILLGALIQAG